MQPNLAKYPPQDQSNRFFTHEEVVQSQVAFQPLFAEALNTGIGIDTMEAISTLSLFINHVCHVESSPNVWSGKNDKLTRMVEFTRFERGIVLPGTILDGRDLHWDYEMGKLDEWLDHMGLEIDIHPKGHYFWSAQTHGAFIGDRLKVPCDAYYALYKSKRIDYPILAYMAEYMSMQLMQLAGKIKIEEDRRIMLFLSTVCKLGSVDLTFIMENRDFLDRDAARLIIEKSANDIGISLKSKKPYPFRW